MKLEALGHDAMRAKPDKKRVKINDSGIRMK